MFFDSWPGLLTFWQQIDPFDSKLLVLINQDWGNSFFDTVLPFARQTTVWIPLYLFLLVFSFMNFGKKAWWWILAIILVAAVSDIISSQIIKNIIWRVRPCRDPNILEQIRFFVNYCPQSSSFTSSHATSHFAQATFIFLTLRHITRWVGLFFVWAFIIAYAQVYCAVHYPTDVFAGAVIGCSIGWAFTKMFHKQVGMLSLVK